MDSKFHDSNYASDDNYSEDISTNLHIDIIKKTDVDDETIADGIEAVGHEETNNTEELQAENECEDTVCNMFNILDKEQELNKLKMRIINIIAHELEHPLKRMLYCVNILNNYRGNLPDNEDINYCFKEMDNTIYTLLELTENVQIINQGSYEELYVNNSALDIHYFVSYIIDDFNFSLLKRRDIVFQVKSNLDLIKNTQNEISNKNGQVHKKFITNKKILSQIIRNILSNAVKFSKRNTVIRVTLINNIKNAEIIIKDNGIGIPKNEMDKIYDLFYKASNALNTEGAGIGLLVVKSALEILGGTIKIESELDKGTTVSCVIPNFEHLTI